MPVETTTGVCMLDLGSHGWTMSMRVKTAVLCHPPLRYLPVRGADVSLACVICQDTKRLVESAHGSKFTDSGPSQCQQATDLWVLTPSLQRPNGGSGMCDDGHKALAEIPSAPPQCCHGRCSRHSHNSAFFLCMLRAPWCPVINARLVGSHCWCGAQTLRASQRVTWCGYFAVLVCEKLAFHLMRF